MVFFNGCGFEPVECQGCGKKIRQNLTEVRFFKHEKGYKKPKVGDCEDKVCKKERARVKSFCSVCAKKIPRINKENICCGHALKCLYEIKGKPGWQFIECADCTMRRCENVKTGVKHWHNQTKKRSTLFGAVAKNLVLRQRCRAN